MSSGACRQISEDAIEITAKSAAHAQQISKRLRDTFSFGEVLPGIKSVTVIFDPLKLRAGDIAAELSSAYDAALDRFDVASNVMTIPVTYGGKAGPDLERICDTLGIIEEDFINQHTRASHRVDMIGFTPGFAYLSGEDAAFNVPREAAPRPRLPAGSVGVSGNLTGLYALSGPGGWPIIGRTDLTLFSPQADDPFLLKPGQRIIFKAV